MIDNKVKIYLIGEHRIKTLESEDPFLFNYNWEQSVTNGLGYPPIRECCPLAEEEQSELIRHLGKMDLCVSRRNHCEEHQMASTLFNDLSNMEEEYIELRKYYNGLVEAITQHLNRVNKKTSTLVERTTIDKEKSSQKPKRNDNFFKKIYGCLREKYF